MSKKLCARKFLAPEIVSAVEQELMRCLASTREEVMQDFPKPDCRVDLRGKTAGLALLREHCIRLNVTMLLQYGENFVNQVVAHEMAHLVAYRRFGNRIRPHGIEWQWLMREVFGREPKVTHNFSARLSHKRAFWYACDCAEPREFSLTRHRRALTGTQYTCLTCKAKLHFFGKNPISSPALPAQPSQNLFDLSRTYLETKKNTIDTHQSVAVSNPSSTPVSFHKPTKQPVQLSLF